MKTILIPYFNERISPRLDCAEHFQIVKSDDNKICSSEKIRILANNLIEMVSLIYV